jgi:hypothetical protein
MQNDEELSRIIKNAGTKHETIEECAYITALYSDQFQEFSPRVRGSEHYSLSGISIMNGNNTTIENYYNNARAKKIKITVNDKEVIVNLEDTPEFQYIYLGFDYLEYTTPVSIKIDVLEKYDGLVSNDVYFSDIEYKIDNNFVSFAR